MEHHDYLCSKVIIVFNIEKKMKNSSGYKIPVLQSPDDMPGL